MKETKKPDCFQNGSKQRAGSEVPPSEAPFKGVGARGGGGDEGLKVEGGFTFGRLQGGFKEASRGLQGGFKGFQGGLKGASPSEGFKRA